MGSPRRAPSGAAGATSPGLPMTRTTEDDIDRLYALPIEDFTAARNALASKAGANGGAIRKLQKPNKPAWVVNQLYWKRRPAYDRLVRASAALREAHARRLQGADVDIRAVESAHQDAVKAATDEIRALLREANDAATPALMIAIVTTLQALPSSGRPGRLDRPLSPMGFEALASIGKVGARILKLPTPAHAHAAAAPRPDVKVAPAAKAMIASLEKQLATAQAGERAALKSLGATRARIARVEEQQLTLEKEARAIAADLGRLRNEAARLQRESADATSARAQIENRLNRMK